jgi:hypothetical protein
VYPVAVPVVAHVIDVEYVLPPNVWRVILCVDDGSVIYERTNSFPLESVVPPTSDNVHSITDGLPLNVAVVGEVHVELAESTGPIKQFIRLGIFAVLIAYPVTPLSRLSRIEIW